MYVDSFECVVVASVWLKALITIDHRNKILKTRKTSIEVKVKNLDSLINDLRYNWKIILEECKIVLVPNINNVTTFPEKRTNRKRLADGLS